MKQNTPTSSYHTKSLADILLAQDKSQSLASGIVPSVQETPSKRSTRQSKKQIDTNHHSTAESRIDAVLKLNSVSQSARQIEVLEVRRVCLYIFGVLVVYFTHFTHFIFFFVYLFYYILFYLFFLSTIRL